MARPRFPCKAARARGLTRRESGRRGWGTSPPEFLPTEGGVVPTEGVEGAGLRPPPGRTADAGALASGPPSREALTLGERHRDEARLAAALHAHQHAVLVVGLRRIDRLAHVTGRRHGLARDLED